MTDKEFHLRKLIEQLERENAALRDDKERLDWLEKNDWSQHYMEDVLYCLIQQRHYAGSNYPNVRAAIDAARKEAKL